MTISKAKYLLLTLLMALSLTTRADSIGDLLTNLKADVAPDKRTAIWDVKSTTQSGTVVVYGTVGTQALKDAIDNRFATEGITDYRNQVIVLEDAMPDNERNALVMLSIATLRCDPRHSAEMATQAIMGTPVKVLEQVGEWYRVQTPDDYISYIPESSVALKTEAQMQQWRSTKRYIVTVYDSQLVTEPKSDETVSDLVLGNILEFKTEKGKWIQLVTPDGREGWVEKNDVAEFSAWAQQNFDVAQIERTAKRMMGSSYLWGGTSTKVTDCSGLVKVSYFSNGIILQRDASQQALTGYKFSDWHEAKAGDLLFFGNSKTGRVTHVGIYLADGRFIHCSGRVKINHLDPDNPDYLYSPLSLSRIDGEIGTRGICYVRDHKWYF